MAPALLSPKEGEGLSLPLTSGVVHVNGNECALKSQTKGSLDHKAHMNGATNLHFLSASPAPADLDCLPTDASTSREPGPLDSYLSIEGKARQQGTLRSLAGQFAGLPGLISLSGGFPPPHLFPFAEISLKLHDGTVVEISDPQEIATAQQYNFALRGNPALLAWLSDHMKAMHDPPANQQVLVTNGGNHTLEMIMSLFLDRGDTFLVEEYTYPVVTESIAEPKGLTPIPIAIDAHGIIPSSLQHILENLAADTVHGGVSPCSTSASSSEGEEELQVHGTKQQYRQQQQQQQQMKNTNGSILNEPTTFSKHEKPKNGASLKMPKLLYTVPVGQNPTGCTVTLERRKAIYELCRQYDIWIIEDDAYFYLQYGTTADTRNASDSSLDAAAAVQYNTPGLTGLGPSYLSLDVDQRVIRVDTFAKFLSPGLRLGWVTARHDVITKLTSTIHSHTVGPCSLSQSVTAATLKAWGREGLHAHVQKAQHEYAMRAAIAVDAARKELMGLAEWSIPTGGMFLWVKLLGVEDSTEIWEDLKEAKVVVLPGRIMHCRSQDSTFKSPYIRLSYSNASEESLREGLRRVGQVLRKHQQSTRQSLQ